MGIWSRLGEHVGRLFAVPRHRRDSPADSSKLVPSINETAKSIGAHTLTLVVTAAYIAVSAAGITDAAFILGDETSLPVVNVRIPVRSFFVLAPALLVLQHLALLLQQYFLLSKLALPDDWPQADTALLHSSISVGRHSPEEHWPPVRALLIFVYWVIYFLLPVAVLVYLQVRSVRYNDEWIRAWIGSCTIVDLVAAAGLILVSALIKENSRCLRRRGGLLRSGWSGVHGKLALILLFVSIFGPFYWKLSRFPAACAEAREEIWGILEVRRYLILDRHALSTRVAQGESQGQQDEGISLRNMVLPCANFSGAPLAHADFRGSVLRGATFHKADLRNARFSGGSGERPANTADLAGANFSGADLTRAQLQGTSLRDASLETATLQEANLVGADLSGVKAFRAEMLAADLKHATLRGADFQEARLAFADLRDARLEFARFWRAQLQGAVFFGASAAGADFRNASLAGARGLELLALNLQGANLWGMDSCEADPNDPSRGSPSAMSLVDLRSVRFDRVAWKALLDTLRKAAEERARTVEEKRDETKNPVLLGNTWTRIMQEPGGTCITQVPLLGTAPSKELLERAFQEQLVLYDGPRPGTPLSDWPKRVVTEEAFYRQLIKHLVDWACWEHSRGIDRQTGSQDWVVLLKRWAEGDDLLTDLLSQELRNVSCELKGAS